MLIERPVFRSNWSGLWFIPALMLLVGCTSTYTITAGSTQGVSKSDTGTLTANHRTLVRVQAATVDQCDSGGEQVWVGEDDGGISSRFSKCSSANPDCPKADDGILHSWEARETAILCDKKLRKVLAFQALRENEALKEVQDLDDGVVEARDDDGEAVYLDASYILDVAESDVDGEYTATVRNHKLPMIVVGSIFLANFAVNVVLALADDKYFERGNRPNIGRKGVYALGAVNLALGGTLLGLAFVFDHEVDKPEEQVGIGPPRARSTAWVPGFSWRYTF